MTLRHARSRWSVLPLLVALIVPQGLFAQQDTVAALKQSLAANAQLQKQYKWVETTVISMKGEEKSRVQKQCFYGPDGKVQKQQLTAPPPAQAAPGGVKGKVVAKKKEEISATMKQAVALVQSYVPPDPQRIQATKAAGKLAIIPSGPDAIRLDLRDYVKSGDILSLGVDTAGNALQTVSVKSYLESEEGRRGYARCDVQPLARRTVLSGQRRAERSRREDPGGGAELRLPAGDAGADAHNRRGPRPAAGRQTRRLADQTECLGRRLDTLTGPIALYPDALVAPRSWRARRMSPPCRSLPGG